MQICSKKLKAFVRAAHTTEQAHLLRGGRGENPSCVKIYNLLTNEIADYVYEKISGIKEVYVRFSARLADP